MKQAQVDVLVHSSKGLGPGVDRFEDDLLARDPYNSTFPERCRMHHDRWLHQVSQAHKDLYEANQQGEQMYDIKRRFDSVRKAL